MISTENKMKNIILYKMLGFLMNDYGGSYNPDKKRLLSLILASFTPFANEKADGFTKMCRSFIEAYRLNDDLKVEHEQISSGGDRVLTNVIFTSANICRWIENSVQEQDIEERLITLYQVPLRERRAAAEQRLAFIAGAYNYHKSMDGVWLFHNNYRKALLIHRLIVELAGEDDELSFTSTFLTPHSHRVALNLDGPLWANVEKFIDL